MSEIKRINVIIFGIGNVGSTLIRQIIHAKNTIWKKQGLCIRIPLITNSQVAFFDKEGVSNSWETDFEKFSIPFDIEDVFRYVSRNKFENLIAIDATADKAFVKNYIPLIENGFHIVSANKLANTQPYGYYKLLRKRLKMHDRLFLYETNVGAGLPIIDTIRNLYSSGEEIRRIRGVFSGSMSYIFNTFSKQEKPFSEVLKEADKLGLTEPDAREDLSGMDVARKLLILARELELRSELDEVKVESLVPSELNGNTTLAEFRSRATELDSPFQNLKTELEDEKVLRYIGELDIETNTLEVKLVSEHRGSPIGRLKGADSVFEIYSTSYRNSPLVIQGAGAGKEVTARGLFTDILKISTTLN